MVFALKYIIYIYICHIRTVYSPETRNIRKIITYCFEYVNNHLNGPHSDSIHRIQANCIRVLAAGVFQFEGTSAYIYVNQILDSTRDICDHPRAATIIRFDVHVGYASGAEDIIMMLRVTGFRGSHDGKLIKTMKQGMTNGC